jgi:hypothetical protein
VHYYINNNETGLKTALIKEEMYINPLKPKREREEKVGGVAIGTTFNGRERT